MVQSKERADVENSRCVSELESYHRVPFDPHTLPFSLYFSDLHLATSFQHIPYKIIDIFVAFLGLANTKTFFLCGTHDF